MSKMVRPLNHTATIRFAGRGFSLLELVLVVVVIGTLAGVAIPRLNSSNDHARADQVVDHIETMYEKARGMARARSKQVELFILKSTDQIRIRIDGVIVERTYLSESPYRADITNMFFAGNNNIVFDGYGMPNVDGYLIVKVGGVERTISFGAAPTNDYSGRILNLVRTTQYESDLSAVVSDLSLGLLDDSTSTESLLTTISDLPILDFP